MPWRIEAWHVRLSDQRPAAVEAHFSVGPRDSYRSVGYFVALPSPLPKAFVFTANAGSEVDDRPEGDLSGIARRRVAKLIVNMRDGSQLVVHPKRAPAHLLRSRPWLRGLRFFDVFFPADQEPRLVAAYGPRGGLLGRHRLP